MRTADLDYDLPPQRIAQQPVEPRDAARLLVDRGPGAPIEHRTVADLADLLRPGDLVVVNDTEVIPARLRLRKPTGGAVEVLLLERVGPTDWEALVRPSRRVAPGTVLTPDGGGVEVEVGPVVEGGRRRVALRVADGVVADALAAVGEVPLPPYIQEALADPGRYQTVFAAHPGSVAAPTAGLHLTGDLLARLQAAGVELATVELDVGLGTFQPIRTDEVADHEMHGERYRVPAATIEAVGRAARVVAIGTTVVRALESWAVTGEPQGRTELFITEPEQFSVVDVLLTNFHVPRSSLLALVQAFVGPRWRELYAAALADGYRFLSFGDAMLLTRRPPAGEGP